MNGTWTGVLIVLLAFQASAQQPDTLSGITPISPADSARLVQSFTVQSGKVDTASSSYTPSKSPGLALLFSGLLPGAGQLYNESYWKIPLVVGVGYYLVRTWFDNNDSTKHYRNLFAASITSENPSGFTRYRELREFYKDQRDTFSWYFFIYYIINLVDAYVDASLYDFNVNDDLSIRLLPHIDTGYRHSVGVSMRVRF